MNRAASLLAVVALVAGLLLCPVGEASAQGIVRDGAVERLIIADGESTEGWAVTEATLQPSAEHARSGKAMLFNITVDWHSGEKKYPIGWPRCWLMFKEPQDWSKWDQLSFWIYADTTREALPSHPLGFIVTTKQFGTWHQSLDTLAKGCWAHFVFPLEDIPGREQVTQIKFYISEANYKDGDVVKFFIDDLELIRYTQPTVVGLQPLARVCYADEPAMPMVIEMLGVPPDALAPVRLWLQAGAATKRVASATVRLRRGRNRVTLRLPEGLSPGMYTLVADDGRRRLWATIRLVASPWQ